MDPPKIKICKDKRFLCVFVYVLVTRGEDYPLAFVDVSGLSNGYPGLWLLWLLLLFLLSW